MRSYRWRGSNTRAFAQKRLSFCRDRNAEEENCCWKRHRNAGHGDSPFSGLALSLSGSLALSASFFLPPKIPKIFCKGFFFLSSLCALGSAGCPGCPVAPGGRLGSDFITTCASDFVGEVWGCPPKICDKTEPVEVPNPWPPCSSQNSVGAEPAT